MSKAKFQENNKSAVKKTGNGKGANQGAKQNAKQNAKQITPKERPWYLSLAILLVLISGIFSTVWALNEKRLLGVSFAEIPWWAWAVFITNVVDIVAAAALWYWKKWGLWLYMASVVTRTVLLVVAGAFGSGFASFLPFAIVGYIVSMHWKKFE
ncbi:MAG: hypothetical protein R6X34_10175 [Chloroflexota bacterium]